MIPEVTSNLLSTPSVFAALGSCSADLRPAFYPCFGLQHGDDGRVTVFVASTGDLATHVETHKTLALNVNQPATNETYQLKGPFVATGELSAEQVQLSEKCREAFIEAIMAAEMGYPREILEAYYQKPKAFVTMEVTEVYLQTPGPEAGKRIAPEEAS